jgi:predicted SAM-dependent methyltransferase
MLNNWVLKAIVQKTISFLPYSEKINYFFQKNITKGVDLNDLYFEQKLTHAIDHYKFLTKYGDSNKVNRVLELGTGWYPVIPLFFFLNGVESIITIDIQSWLKKENLILTIKKFLEYREKQTLPILQESGNVEKWEILLSIVERENSITYNQILEAIHLEYVIQDAGNLSLENDSIDFICSNNTLEHVKNEHLSSILIEFKRILNSEGGVMSHFIDMTDHFAHFDTRISVYNYLKYSRKMWKLIDNNIQHMNRLRLVDYKNIYEELQIPITEEQVTNESKRDLENIRIHKAFSKYTNEELAITHAYLVSKF